MFYIVGGFFILLALIRIIVILATSGRPKQEVTIQGFNFMKLKTDLFGFGGNQQHAKVAYTVNGQTYESDIFVGKKFKTPVGGTMMISYKPSAPKEAKYHNPKMEWVMVLVLLIMGGILCAINGLVLSLLN